MNNGTSDRFETVTRRVTATLLAMSAGALLTILLYAAVDSRSSSLSAQDRSTAPGAVLPRQVAPPPFSQPPIVNVAPPQQPPPARGSATAEDLSSAFRDVAIRMRPSVVSIRTKTIETIRGRQLPPGLPREFQQFFGGSRTQQRESSGVGSGVIVSADGFVLTNNHVVDGASELIVEMTGGQTATGTVVGTDPQTDLAVVKIDVDNVVPVRFGNSDDIRVGDWVLAIGSPFGLDQTVTAGIISGKNRVQDIIADGRGFEDFLQTDAAINPGNSGGPLVNLRGELVGINTAILSRSGGSAGIGFAIPVSMAIPVLESIIETGEVQRGFLGARVVDITPELVAQYDLKASRGAFVFEVLADRPAARGGLLPGDVVTKIEDRVCTGGTQLRTYVASRRPGAVFSVTVDRGGEPFETQIQLDRRTDEAMSQFGVGTALGARLVPVTAATAAQYGYSADQKGLVITEVEDESTAAQIGLEVGDILEAAAEVELETATQFQTILDIATKQKQIVRVIVRRGEKRIMLPLEPTR